MPQARHLVTTLAMHPHRDVKKQRKKDTERELEVQVMRANGDKERKGKER